ncbi:MAG: MraY family glycosyltransferase, partial [Phycisphaerae bacterium]|nr:MraY family glycosyltransferase [Phycisphaerae bacterium]
MGMTPSLIAVLVAVAVALATALLAVPAARGLARRLNIVDTPDALLKPHAKPTAYLGGVGFYVAWLAGLLAARLVHPAGVDARVWVVAALGGGILLVGLLDDIRDIKPWQRLLAEAAAAILLFAFGVRFMGLAVLDPTRPPGMAVALALQVIVVIGACNSTNLLDGLDGLCGGVTAIVLTGLAAIAAGAFFFHRAEVIPLGNMRLVVVIALPLAAALVGFLVYNHRPASIFMGDAGSMLLGFIVAACIALLGVRGTLGLTLSISGLVAFALPIGDTMLAFVRRAINRQ